MTAEPTRSSHLLEHGDPNLPLDVTRFTQSVNKDSTTVAS